MGTYAWNILYSKILPPKSRTRRRRPATQAGPSQAVHRNLATGPNLDGIALIHVEHLIVSLDQLSLQTTVLTFGGSEVCPDRAWAWTGKWISQLPADGSYGLAP